MPPVVDAFPFPWPRPEAQELHRVLVNLYPNEKRVIYVAGTAGIQEGELASGAPFDMWSKVLDLAASRQATRQLVTFVRDQNPRSPSAPFLDALLRDAPTVIGVEPRNPDGSARFLSGTDTPTEQETLLFHDDLSILVGRLPAYIDTLRKMMEWAPAVCLLRVSAGPWSTMGTGFRIADDLLLTNHHVLFPNGLQATQVVAEFGFETDARDADLPSRRLTCDSASIVADASDDWGVIRVTDAMAPEWPRVDLAQAVAPVLGEGAFILQHPLGTRKRLGFTRNTITEFNDRVVHYLTDTQQGSSGSPVFNAEGKLVALHHAGGTPQEVAGKLPLIKNEGIRIPRILDALRKQNVPV
jgi:S1-C subfamily serine protease